ncbi:MAG: hypothetical protein WC821_01040 [archaeon]
MISEKLAGIYTKAEDKYFDTLDFLDGKGLPVYKYSDFFENKGIPSFVVTIAIIVLLLLILSLLFTYKGPDVNELTLSLRDADGSAMQNVKLVITDEKGAVLFDGLKSDGDRVALNRGLYNGEKILLTASKDGFQPKSLDFTVGKDNTAPRVSFSKAYEGIEGKIRLIDNETKTIIYGATVIASTKDLSLQFDEDSNGFYKKSGVPTGVTMLLKLSAEGYNNYEQQVTFSSKEVKTIELIPSNQSYVGKANILINVKDIDGKTISDAKVDVYDKQKNLVVLNGYTADGVLIGEVEAGTSLRIVVTKQGYLTNDSDDSGAGITIRKQEDKVDIVLKQGGQKLHVSVLDSKSGFAIDNAIVRIYKLNGEVFAEQTSTIAGTDFTGIDSNATIYITASKENYLPKREQVLVSTTEEVKILMESVGATNSARLDIYTSDSLGTSINGVNLEFFEIKDGNKLPYGLAGGQTTFAGYYAATVSPAKTYEIIGTTEIMGGRSVVEVKAGEADKKVYLVMAKKEQVLEMKFIDVYGKDVTGKARISGLDGTLLFDDLISNSRVFLDAGQREIIEVQVTLDDGNVFTENVTVKGKDYVEVVVYSKDASTLTPVMEYIGLEDEQGTEVKGLTPGAFYWAKFSVAYPLAATKGGVHFRSGADNVPFAESEKFAVYDLSFQGAQISQSNTYTPSPVPGNEVVDRSNTTMQGDKSKWIEGVITDPQGTYTVKVKVRAEDFSEGKVQLHFRAWSVVGEDYYRLPDDVELLTKSYSDKKAGVYAATNTEDLTLYEALPDCKDNICLTTNFFDESEQLIKEVGFEALTQKVYALEIEVTAMEADYVQLTASTDNNTISFVSTQTGNFNFVREAEAKGTGSSKASAAIALVKNGKEKTRFYFKTNNIGNAQISVKAVGVATVEKNLAFKVVQEKTLLVELSESQIMAGKNFTVKVNDQGLKGITDALVKIINKDGKIVKSVVGEGTDGKGKNGYYRIQNDLSVGLYTAEVSVPTYATNTVPLLITTQNILSFTDAIEVKMPLGTKSNMISEILSNNSEFTVQNIFVSTDGEELKDSTGVGENTLTSESGKFKITAIAPSALGKDQKQSVQITVSYIGESDDSADETSTITISGLVEGKFLTKVSATVHMTYNRKLDASCLVITPNKAIINLLGTQGSTDSDVIEVTNNCDQSINLTKRIRAVTKNSYIRIEADDIDLQQGETKNITITATNGIDRANSREQIFSYEVVYDSNYLKKTVSVNVKTINPALALTYPPQITLWLTQNSAAEKAIAAQPLFVTNTSAFPVDNIGFSVDNDYTSGANVKISVEPSGTTSLLPGQAIIPTKLVIATANNKISEPARAQIQITGKMGQLNNQSGQNDRYGYYNDYYDGTTPLNNYYPKTSNVNYYQNTNQTLGLIEVIVYYSGYNCLSANIVSDSLGYFDYLFPPEGGQLAKKISVTNKCAEPVRIVGATPAGQAMNQVNPIIGFPITSSSIMMSLPMVTIGPGEQINVPMTIITAIPNVNRKNYSVVVNGITEVSQTPIISKPFTINIFSGLDMASEHVKANNVKIKVCGGKVGEELTQEVTIPKISDNANCGEAYCDAVQAAKYLDKIIRQIRSKAQSQGYSAKNLEETYDCQNTGACTFEEIGMQPEYIDLYLQNDALTPYILQKQMNGEENEGASSTPFRETSDATGFIVVPGEADTTLLKMRAMAYDKTVFLDPVLQGCGYYKLFITGAFGAGVEGINSMTPVLSIKAVPQGGSNKLVTRECQSSITNIPNFNPIDTGLTTSSNYGTWLTTVESDTLLKDMAAKIAKARFGSDNRTLAGSGNKVKIVQGALVDSIAQICLTGGEKKIITVTVDSSIAKADALSKATFTNAIVDLVQDTLVGNFGDNCLIKTGEVYSCVKLNDSGNLGRRRLELTNSMLAMNSSTSGVESCVTGTIYSNVPETLTVQVEPINPSASGKYFNAIREIQVKANDSIVGPETKLTTIGQSGITVNANSTTESIIANQNSQADRQAVNDAIPTKNPIGASTSTKTNVAADDSKVEKLSFADVVPALSFADTVPAVPTAEIPNTTNVNSVPSTVSTRNLRTDYYTVSYMGGNLVEEKINYPIELKFNQNSKDYKYYRNIKICALASDPTKDTTASSTDGTPVYVLANGVQFTLGIVALNQSQPESSAKQLITINTGTLHPKDLLQLVLSKSVETGKGYYFTPMWKDGPQTIDLTAYETALVRQGNFDAYSIAGNEQTEKDLSAISAARQGAVKSYAIGCGITSAVCNTALTGGIWGAALSVLTDCGLPLMTVLQSDFAETKGGRVALSGADKFVNGVLDIFESVLGLFGKKSDWNLDWFVPTKIESQSLSGYSLTKSGLAAGEGAFNNAVLNGFRASTGRGFANGINSSNIKTIASDVAEPYVKEFEKILEESFDPKKVSQFDIAYMSTGYKDELVTELTKEMQKNNLIKPATKPTVLQSAKSRLLTPPQYNSVETNIELSIKNNKLIQDPASYVLTKPAGSKLTNFEEMLKARGRLPKNADDLTKLMIPGSPLEKIIKAKLKLDLTLFNTTLKSSFAGYADNLGSLVQPLDHAELRPLIEDLVSQTVPGIKGQDKIDLIDKIHNKIPVKSYMGSQVGKKGLVAGTGYRVDSIINEIKLAAKPEIEVALKSSSSLTTAIDDIAKEISPKVKAGGDLGLADMTKTNNLRSKINSMWSKSGAAALGKGIFCGLVSNAVGMKAYKDEIGDSITKINGDMTKMKESVFVTKGKLYMLRLDSEHNLVVSEIQNVLDLKRPVNGKLPEQKYSKEVGGLLPEQRLLGAYPIVTSRKVAVELMKSTQTDYVDDYASGDPVNVIKTNPYKRMFGEDSKFPEVLFRYTSTSGLDCKTNPNLITINGTTPNAAEPIAIAIATTKLGQREYSPDSVVQEAEGKSTWLKGKLTTALVAISKNSENKVDLTVAKAVFPNTTDQKLLEQFVRDSTLWIAIYSKSRQEVGDFCPQ